jgi:hypothetical protein
MLPEQRELFSRSDTTWCETRDPHGPTASTRTFFHTGPKSQRTLPTPLGSSQYPQVSPLATSPFACREIGTHKIASSVLMGSGLSIPRNPMVKGQRLRSSGIFPIGNLMTEMQHLTYVAKLRAPNPDTTPPVFH